MIVLPIFFQIVLEYDALAAGVALAPLSLSMFAVAMLMGSAARPSAGQLVTWGFGLLLVGMVAVVVIVPLAERGWPPGSARRRGIRARAARLPAQQLHAVADREERVSEAAGVNSAAGSFGLSFGLALGGAMMLATLSRVHDHVGQQHGPARRTTRRRSPRPSTPTPSWSATPTWRSSSPTNRPRSRPRSSASTPMPARSPCRWRCSCRSSRPPPGCWTTTAHASPPRPRAVDRGRRDGARRMTTRPRTHPSGGGGLPPGGERPSDRIEARGTQVRDAVLTFEVGDSDGRRPVELTPLESVMWHVGQDATLRMTIGVLLLLDRPPDADALRAPSDGDGDRGSTAAPAGAAAGRTAPSGLGGRRRCRAGRHIRFLSMAGAAPQHQLLDLVGAAGGDAVRPERVAVGPHARRWSGARPRPRSTSAPTTSSPTASAASGCSACSSTNPSHREPVRRTRSPSATR